MRKYFKKIWENIVKKSEQICKKLVYKNVERNFLLIRFCKIWEEFGYLKKKKKKSLYVNFVIVVQNF